MIDEGSKEIMTELILKEKELEEKIASLDAQLVTPLKRLEKAKALLLKAKHAYETILADVQPLKSEKILLQGELASILEKKSAARIEARKIEVGGIRPGTAEFVEQLNEMAGDAETARMREETERAKAEGDLADLKERMGSS